MGAIDRNPMDGYKLLFTYVVIVIIGLFCAIKSCAQTIKPVTHHYDTLVANVNCIDKYIEQPTSTGKSTRVYVVYNDDKLQISDIIPVSKSVMEYINLCRTNGITPSLGIKLRDGEISSLIRIKRRVRYGTNKNR